MIDKIIVMIYNTKKIIIMIKRYYEKLRNLQKLQTFYSILYAFGRAAARKRPDVAANVCERGQGGQANAPFSRRPSYRRRRSIRGSDSRIKLFALLFF